MPRYYCDYCDTYLTHDSPTVRKTHCSGRKHKDNVTFYYRNWLAEQTQALINATTAELKAIQSRAPPMRIPVGYQSGYVAPNAPPAGNVPIPGFPHIGLRPNLPPAGFHPVGLHPNLPPAGFHPVGLHPNLPPAGFHPVGLHPNLPPTGFHSAGLHPNMPQQGFYPHVPPNMGMGPMPIPPMAGMGMQQSIHPRTITAPPYLKK